MKTKYFLAIVPPDKLLEKVELIKQDLFTQHGLKGALRSPAHITLHRPFEWKIDKEEILIEKLKKFGNHQSFDIELINYNCFSPRVIFIDVVKNEQLIKLHYDLMHHAKSELNLFNEVEDMRGFHPHLTVAFKDLKKQKFLELWEEFKTLNFSETFIYTGFCLLKMERKWEILKKFTI